MISPILHLFHRQFSSVQSQKISMAENEIILKNIPFKAIEAHYHDHSVRHPKAQIILFGYALKRYSGAIASLQTPPYNSFRNPVRQGIGIMKEETMNFVTKLKHCSGISDIREVAKKHPMLKEELLDAVQPAKILIYFILF